VRWNHLAAAGPAQRLTGELLNGLDLGSGYGARGGLAACCWLATRRRQRFLLLRLGDDGPVRRRADVAANQLKLRSIGGPHELSRLTDDRLVEHLDQLGVLPAITGSSWNFSISERWVLFYRPSFSRRI
jgi:hypothetical protein